METRETRGQRIKRLREAKKLTQPELGKKLGVTKAAVSKWEAAASPNIDLDVFFKLADEFGIDPRELATGIASMRQEALPRHRLELMQMYGRLPPEIRADIRSLVTTLSAAHSERYATWSRAEGERAAKRDAPKVKSKDEA
jgi:transcriptional regulator with XRE-family HTH domain